MNRMFWYVPLESLKARYTSQLCETWIPNAFKEENTDYTWAAVIPPVVSQEIKVGSVLDAVNRGVVSMQQIQTILVNLDKISSDDVIYFQDFWTPGIEALLYALQQVGKTPRIYAMVHAQSVDEYDFTYPMRSWMRPIEVGWSRAMAGVFVASTIHREQLRAAGFECPIHVVGLPIQAFEVANRIPSVVEVSKNVVFSSRLNREKNPWFMLEVAQAFLAEHEDWTWTVTTSGARFVADDPAVLSRMRDLAVETNGRLRYMSGLTKNDYYAVLRQSQIQFNSSLQDYVSWTLLEACIAGCDLCYPNFRSFPECVDRSRLYQAFEVDDALRVLEDCIKDPRQWSRPVEVCDAGRLLEMRIMLQDIRHEVNVWHGAR